MEIWITGKLEINNSSFYSERQRDSFAYIGEGFVFVDYLTEDIFLGDSFVLDNGTEITLAEIKLQFPVKEPLQMMGQGWACFCRFDNLDLQTIPAVKYWSGNVVIAAKRTERTV